MKKKLPTIIAGILMTTNAIALADDYPFPQIAANEPIAGTSAGGDQQMTIIDANGNLKVVDQHSKAAKKDTSTPSSEPMVSAPASPDEQQATPPEQQPAMNVLPPNDVITVPSDNRNVPANASTNMNATEFQVHANTPPLQTNQNPTVETSPQTPLEQQPNRTPSMQPTFNSKLYNQPADTNAPTVAPTVVTRPPENNSTP